jgi:hypothetical protein
MFIDDLLGESADKQPHRVVGRLAASAAALQVSIDDELGCQVAQHKSALIASSDKLLHDLKRAFGRFAGEAKLSAPNLGVDFFAGRRRAHRKSVTLLRAREGKFLHRCRRLGALRRGGYNMRELFITGLQSFSHYGTEVVGMDVKQLQKARANYLSLVGATCKSAKTNLSLAALGDPLWRQALGPALTWSTLVWKATTHANYRDVVTVPELGRLAGPIMLKLPRTWGEVRGPVGAAALSLRRVGWTFDTCLTLVTDEGVHLPLTSTSPAMVAYHLQVSWKRRLGEAAARSLGLDG